ncbi:hypothetical protein ACFC1I_07750 [Microbacterium sp. NPDC056044]|uniref:hypothetical protein n=1 Tax=Microbacterium sp. NPDC056044 TaxID=3345690 RepID=UPI0035E13657
MRRRLAPLLVAAALLLSGCAAGVTAPTGTTSPSAGPAVEPGATPTPSAPSTLVLTADGIELTDASESTSLPFGEPEPLIAAVERLVGTPAVVEDLPDPWGNGEVVGTTYTWDDITVMALIGGPSTVTIRTTTVGGIPARTASGIAVGTPREDVVAAGVWDAWGGEGDPTGDYLGIDGHDVPGTQALARPEQVGKQYVVVSLDSGGVVTELQSPVNNFSDL